MNEFSNMKQKLLAEQVQEQIYRYMKEQNYQIGDKMPNEYELASLFSVGRSTIREAVKLLASKGLLEVRRGSGTYVSGTVPADIDPLGLSRMDDKMGLALDLADVRMILEPGIAELAAINGDERDIRNLECLCEAVERKILDGDSYIREDIAFHAAIAECAKNKVVEQLLPIIDTAVLMFVNVTHTQLREETIQTHRAILDAIRDHDSIGARAAMTMHMAYNREMIRKRMKDKE